MEALGRGMAGSSLMGFYYLARAVLVKSETHFDRYDLAFADYFTGIETPVELTEKVLKWLEKRFLLRISPEERKQFQNWDLDELRRQLEERLREQKGEHHGGGTGSAQEGPPVLAIPGITPRDTSWGRIGQQICR